MSLQQDMINYRARENISQSELAERCKLSYQTIGQIERGIQEPTPRTKAKIRLIIGGAK